MSCVCIDNIIYECVHNISIIIMNVCMPLIGVAAAPAPVVVCCHVYSTYLSLSTVFPHTHNNLSKFGLSCTCMFALYSLL